MPPHTREEFEAISKGKACKKLFINIGIVNKLEIRDYLSINLQLLFFNISLLSKKKKKPTTKTVETDNADQIRPCQVEWKWWNKYWQNVKREYRVLKKPKKQHHEISIKPGGDRLYQRVILESFKRVAVSVGNA